MSERVHTRLREPEPPLGSYEEILRRWQQKRDQQAMGAVVLRARDVPWETTRQGTLRYYSHPRNWATQAAPGWLLFELEIRRHSGKHLHQGGLVIFVLAGQGYSVIDGARHEWEAGDLLVLPIQPGGCEHQHFNATDGEAVHWVAFCYEPFFDVLGSEMIQREVSADWAALQGSSAGPTARPGPAPTAPSTTRSTPPSAAAPPGPSVAPASAGAPGPPAADGAPDSGAPTLLDRLFALRDAQRAQLRLAQLVVRGRERTVERNRMGQFRWYLHPEMPNLATRTLLFYVQELPPGGRSGQQLHQGGRVHYVWEGRGYTIVEGIRHPWETGDIIMLPVKPEGTTHQHVNTDAERPARLLVAEPNFVDSLGVDLGAGLEQVGDAPVEE
jgi:quercetin dioxygenase-like cupin family protein